MTALLKMRLWVQTSALNTLNNTGITAVQHLTGRNCLALHAGCHHDAAQVCGPNACIITRLPATGVHCID
jgi:hypothetical protein